MKLALPDLPGDHHVHVYDRSGYLNKQIAVLGGRKLVDVIKFLANSYGGVHLVPYLKEEDQRHFAEWNKRLKTQPTSLALALRGCHRGRVRPSSAWRLETAIRHSASRRPSPKVWVWVYRERSRTKAAAPYHPSPALKAVPPDAQLTTTPPVSVHGPVIDCGESCPFTDPNSDLRLRCPCAAFGILPREMSGAECSMWKLGGTAGTNRAGGVANFSANALVPELGLRLRERGGCEGERATDVLLFLFGVGRLGCTLVELCREGRRIASGGRQTNCHAIAVYTDLGQRGDGSSCYQRSDKRQSNQCP